MHEEALGAALTALRVEEVPARLGQAVSAAFSVLLDRRVRGVEGDRVGESPGAPN